MELGRSQHYLCRVGVDAISARQALAELVVALAVRSRLSPDVARAAAPSLFRLARAGLVQSLVRGENGASAVTELMTRFAEIAAASGAPALSHLADWWMLAFCGQPIDGGFFSSDDLPLELSSGLSRELKFPRRLAGRALRREHDRRSSALQGLADDVTPTSRELFEGLILGGTREIQRRLDADPCDDLGDIVDVSPERLVEKADPARTVPRNGLRWPGLVGRARELQQHARAVMATSRALANVPDDATTTIASGDAGDLWTALTEDPPGIDPLDLVLREPPEAAGAPRLCLAALLDRLGIAAPGIEPDIDSLRQLSEPVTREYHRILSLIPNLDEQAAVEARQCIEWGLLDDARVWLDELERAVELHVLATREEFLRSRLNEVPGPSRPRLLGIFDSLRAMIAQRNSVAANALVDGAEALLENLTGKALEVTAEPEQKSIPNGLERNVAPVATKSQDMVSAILVERLTTADETERRRLLRDLLSDANQLNIVEVARAFCGREESWFWQLLAQETEPEQRPIWGTLRATFLNSVATSPSLEGLLLPPVPPTDRRYSSALGATRHLSVIIPKRRFTAASAAVTGPATTRLEAGDYDGAAKEFLNAARDGWRIGFAHAIACLLEHGDPSRALGVYTEYLSADAAWFVPANIAWNVGVAYEWIGDSERAIASVRYFLQVVPSELGPGQAVMVKAFGDSVGADPPLEIASERPSSEPGVIAPLQLSSADIGITSEAFRSDSQVEEMLAKEEYERGQVREAEARLRRLLIDTPKSPGAFLLLRIFRESKRWSDGNALIAGLRKHGGATWRHELELARIAVECGQPRASLDALDRAAKMEAKSAFTVDFVRLHAQASESAAQEAKSVATLGGKRVDSAVVLRLSSGGNLTREDWSRATRRTIQDGMLASVLDAAASVVGREPWVVGSLVDSLIDLDEALGNSELRRRLILFVSRSDSASAAKLAEYLERLATEARGDAALLRRDMCDLLRMARSVAAPALELRLARLEIRTLISLGRTAEAGELRNSALPPQPDMARLGQTPIDSHFPPIDPVFSRLAVSRGIPDSCAAAITITRERDDETPVANFWVKAVEDGALLALPNAMGWLIREGRTPEAIELYVRHSEEVGLGVPILWNTATALSRVGQLQSAAAWFSFCAHVNERDQSLEQLSARDALFRHLDLTPPPRRGFSDDLPAEDALSPARLRSGLRILRDRVATGQISAEEAFSQGEILLHRCVDRNDVRDAWAIFLFETGRSRDSLELLRAMAAEEPALSGPALHALLEVVRDLDEEAQGVEILQAQPSSPSVLMVLAKLHYALGDAGKSRAAAEGARQDAPSWHEPQWFLEMLSNGRSPLSSNARAPRIEVLHTGLTTANDVELLIRAIPRPTLMDARITVGGQQRLLGDLATRELVVLRIPRDRAGQKSVAVMLVGTVDGTRRKRTTYVARPSPSPRLVVRFDPTQAVTDSMFVGRQDDMEAIQDHYINRRQILFLGGPRQVGKTSIIRKCVREHGRDSRGLVFIMMEGETYSVDQPFLAQLVATMRTQLARLGRALEGTPGLVVHYTDFVQWAVTVLRDALGVNQLVVAIDEVQEMLDRLSSSGRGSEGLSQVAGLIRTINADEDLPIKFLFLGSCTYRSVRDRLDGTNVQAEISEQLVGFLDRGSSAALVVAGFQSEPVGRGGAFVLEEAQETFWDLTGGYPNHLHLLGAKVGELLNERGERVVDRSVVEQAADALVHDDRTIVQHLLGREREREYQQSVLSALAEYFGDDDTSHHAPTRSDLLEAMGPENAEGIDRFLRLGLLRNAQGAVRVANGLIRRWLVENSLRLELQRRGLGQTSSFDVFEEAGLEIVSAQPDEFGERLVLRRGRDEFFLARRIPPTATADMTEWLEIPSEVSDASVSELRDIVSSRWFLFLHAYGRSLADASSNADKNWERDDTRRVVRTFRDAIGVILEQNSVTRWVHGNISPECVIERAGRSPFISNWNFGCSHQRTALTDFRASQLRPPEQYDRYENGGAFVSSDDVFGIGASLFHVLDPAAGYPYPPDTRGCAHTGAAIAELRQVGVDEDLERVISASVAADPEERPTLDHLRTAMTAWLDRFG